MQNGSALVTAIDMPIKLTVNVLLLALALPLLAMRVGLAEVLEERDSPAVPTHRQAQERHAKAFWNEHIVPEGASREPQEVLDRLQAASERGHPEAQTLLGQLLIESGQEAARTEGLGWLAKAGEQGHAVALMALGMAAHDRGETAPAIAYFERAAATGEPDANYGLGLMYLNGESVEPDASRAADLFETAARAGHADAQARLAGAYWNGEGRKLDREEAYFWFLLAAPESAPAKDFLDTAGSAIKPARQAAVRARAAAWKPKTYVPRWIEQE